MLKMNPEGHGFKFPSRQLIIFQIEDTKIVKKMLEFATVSDIERLSMTIFIEITSPNRRINSFVL
jgi:hypothetical protein